MGWFAPSPHHKRYNVDPKALAEPGGTNALGEPVAVGRPYTLVSSEVGCDGLHVPVLDIDFEAALVPSTTEGHYHLYLEGLCLSWPEYRRLLKALARAGVITEGYLRHSLRRKQTCVRRPGLKKLPEELERESAYATD